MDSGRNYNVGRGGGAGGRGRGRGRGGGRGNYQNQGGRGRGNNQSQPSQGGGRGWDAPHRGSHHQPPAQHQWVNRPPVQANQPAPHSAPPTQQQWVSRPPVQANQPAPHSAWANRPPQTSAPQQPHQVGVNPASGRAGTWTGRPWGPSPPSIPPVQPASPQRPPQPSADDLDIQTLKISEEKALSSSSESKSENQPIRRPDQGGTLSVRRIRLLVNHFPLHFDEEKTIIHYDVDVKPVPSNGNGPMKTKLRKSEMRFIKDQLFTGDQLLKTAYDGEKNIFSAVPLPTGQFTVKITEGEDVRSGSYTFTIKFVNELRLSRLNDYIRGNLSYVPRDALQGMDLVMKENPLRKRIFVGRSFFSPRNENDLGVGLTAYKGFQQSLKPTSGGLTLCLDYSTLAFRKPWPVIEFLKEHIPGFRGVNDVKRLRREINNALKGLKVRVNHRRTKQKYIIAELTQEDTRDIYFNLVDPEGRAPPQRTSLVTYFEDKWGKIIMHQNIPCLELGKSQKSNKVPMEFCELVEGQRYPNEGLDKDTAIFLKKLTLAKPWDRRNTICEMVRAEDGPCGDVARSFGIQVDVNMTKVLGRIIRAPDLKLGGSRSVKVDVDKCQWNLLGKSFVDGKSVDRWALLDFTDGDRYNKLQADAFINNLRGRCGNLGIQMAVPLVHRVTRMNELSSVNRLENLLKNVVEESRRKNEGKLQIIVCVMTKKDPGYKNLKWVSETRIGVVTQCCLSSNANKSQDQYLANLCLKINAKLGGSNFELIGKLPHFDAEDHVMFIGADVNHPAANNTSCPSIAAVVGTVNWPAANRYAARVSPQAHRCEKIKKFGTMCLNLVDTYARLNKVRPRRIIVFRDGVSEGQFEMVLTEELLDLKDSIYDGDYRPTITVVVAQKRHQTRLFVENRNDGGASGNVPPGTVVDTEIVHPHDFDFYLCSHFGGLGTSKPTHYYVLWDENLFTSDELQKLIYDMCFTFVRCTKPVSLVPPVYYADLVAYRGRMFQEVVMEAGPRASSSHQASTSASPSSTTSFDESFYLLHPELENIMFFV